MAGLTPSDVCVVIPAYNEGAHVAGVVARVREKGYPVVVVDDGSTDDTVRLCRASGATVLEASRNQGKGAAMKRGFEWFLGADAPRRYEALIFMDADGQHDPADLTRFLEALSGGGALILGNRMSRPEGMPLVRRLTNRFMSSILSALAGQRVPDSQCGYRALSRELVSRLRLRTDRFEIESEMLLEASRMGFRVSSVPVRCVYADEKSQVNPFRDTLRFLRFLALYPGRR